MSDGDVVDLGHRLASAWRVLEEGVRNRHAPAHTPALATVDAHGRPQVRTLVLRKVEAASGLLRLHTDTRSSKWTDLLAHPQAQLLVYDASRKLQLRLVCVASLQSNGDPADAAWAASRAMSRRCYQQRLAPGTAVSSPDQGTQVCDDPELARARFGVIDLAVQEIDLLTLAAAGHRRSRHVREKSGWVGTWTCP